MVDVALSVVVLLLIGSTIMGLLYFLVTKDFLLPEKIRTQKGVGSRLIAVAWILCVSSASVAIFAWILRIVPEAAKIFARIVPEGAKTLKTVSNKVFSGSHSNLPDLWSRMGYLQKSVTFILLIEFIWSLTVIIDRFHYYSAARRESRRFAILVASALSEGKLDEAIRIAGQNKESHLAEVVGAGLREFKKSSGADGQGAIDSSRRALERAEAIVLVKLRLGLRSLASISATALLLAGLGVLTGIYSGDKSSVSVIISLGAAVAVVTVAARIYFVSRIEAFDLEMVNSSSELVDYFEKWRGSSRGRA
jgi:hypothetical protein